LIQPPKSPSSAMEVQITDSEGIPQDAFVSIRVGTTRRQVPFEQCSSAFKFPSSRDAVVEPMKIDIFQQIASAKLVLHPKEDEYHIGLSGAADISLGLKLWSGKAPGADVRNPANSKESSAKSARDYLEGHGLLKYMQSLLHAIIQARPEDPYAFMQQQVNAGLSGKTKRTAEADVAKPQKMSEEDNLFSDVLKEPVETRQEEGKPQVAEAAQKAEEPQVNVEDLQALPKKDSSRGMVETSEELEQIRHRVRTGALSLVEDGKLEQVIENSLKATNKGAYEESALKEFQRLRNVVRNSLEAAVESGLLQDVLREVGDGKT